VNKTLGYSIDHPSVVVRILQGINEPQKPFIVYSILDLKARYRRDSARCVKRPSRSLKVIQRGTYDFLLPLNSNLTSSFNRS